MTTFGDLDQSTLLEIMNKLGECDINDAMRFSSACKNTRDALSATRFSVEEIFRCLFSIIQSNFEKSTRRNTLVTFAFNCFTLTFAFQKSGGNISFLSYLGFGNFNVQTDTPFSKLVNLDHFKDQPAYNTFFDENITTIYVCGDSFKTFDNIDEIIKYLQTPSDIYTDTRNALIEYYVENELAYCCFNGLSDDDKNVAATTYIDKIINGQYTLESKMWFDFRKLSFDETLKNKYILRKINMLLDAGRSLGGGNSIVYILGRKRHVTKVGKKLYITYNKQQITLARAKQLENKHNRIQT